MTKKGIYCIYCGTENNLDLDRCTKCNKKLKPKNTIFKDYLYNHLKDDLKGKVKDNIFSYLKNYIISHLYGTIMGLSIIFTTVVLITTHNPYKNVSSINDIKKDNSNEVLVYVSTYDDSCSDDFDESLSDIPFSFAGAISGLKKTITKLDIKNTSINDWCLDNHNEELICQETLYLYNSNIDNYAEEYRNKVLDYASWVRKNGINDSRQYAKLNSELNELMNKIFLQDDLEEYDKSTIINKTLDLYVKEIGCLYEMS